MSSAPPLDADARAQMMSALEGYKRIGNKFDSVGSTLDVPSTFDTTKSFHYSQSHIPAAVLCLLQEQAAMRVQPQRRHHLP